MKQRRQAMQPSNATVLPPSITPDATMGNAALQDHMLTAEGNEMSASVDQLQANLAGDQTGLLASNANDFMKTNLYRAMARLVEKEGWDEEFAASWLGQAVVETGKQNLEQLDVVEKGSGAGRGMFQYTGDRRHPYDRARGQALNQGKDVNDINWQIDYALNQDNPAMDLDRMRNALTDKNQNYKFEPRWGTASGYSPTGVPYGNKFSDANGLMNAYGDDRVGGYTRALSGEYTRPGKPHMDRRLEASKRILANWRAARKMRRPAAPNGPSNGGGGGGGQQHPDWMRRLMPWLS